MDLEGLVHREALRLSGLRKVIEYIYVAMNANLEALVHGQDMLL